MNAGPVPSNATPPRVGGWLLLLALGLLVLPILESIPLISLISLAVRRSSEFPAFTRTTFIAANLDVARWAFSVYAGISLLRIRPGAPFLAGLFLLTNVVILVLVAVVFQFSDLPPRAKGPLMETMIVDVLRGLSWAVVWGLYLLRSKRVRDTYPAAGTPA